MRRLLIAFCSFFAFLALPDAVAAQRFDHSEFTRLLRTHVSERGVDYAQLKAQRAALDEYVTRIGTVTAAQFVHWHQADQIAYLLNAYNALVLRTVIDNYPIRRSLRPAAIVRPANSVWQIAGFFDDLRHRVAGEQLTLDMIEHTWLRPRYREPRIHFALVCAARSCPPLRNEAYEGERLDDQLADQARQFLNDSEQNRFDLTSGKVILSAIFKWFGDDFGERERDVVAFVSTYTDSTTREWLLKGKYRLSYGDYDWNLNDVAVR